MPATDERLGRFTIGTIVLAALLVLLVAQSSVPPNAVPLPRNLRTNVQQLFPEGWPLFTRDPHHPQFRVARSRDGRWTWANAGPLGKPANAFGLDRAARWQSIEIPRLVAQLPPDDEWPECRGNRLSCLAGSRQTRIPRINNGTPISTLCGRVGFVKHEVVEWDQERRRPGLVLPSRFIVADVAC